MAAVALRVDVPEGDWLMREREAVVDGSTPARGGVAACV